MGGELYSKSGISRYYASSKYGKSKFSNMETNLIFRRFETYYGTLWGSPFGI